MDLRAFLPPLSVATGNRDQDFLERDVRIHFFLRELMGDPLLRAELLFKGGTYLIKTVIQYARFSEDLDFTWFTQPQPEGRTTKARRRPFDTLRRDIVDRVDAAARRAGLARDPGGLKVDRHGQLLTLLYGYEAAIGGAPRIVKFEVSLQERLLHEPIRVHARSLLVGPPPPSLLLADEQTARVYARPVEVRAYALREAQAEKVRAFLTRGAVRGRDLFDLYELDRLGHPVEDAHQDAVAKVRYSLDHWDRYRINDRWHEQLAAVVRDAEVERLALSQPSPRAIETFAKRLGAMMERVVVDVAR